MQFSSLLIFCNNKVNISNNAQYSDEKLNLKINSKTLFVNYLTKLRGFYLYR